MTKAEFEWGRKNKLRKTNLVTWDSNYRDRIVYIATAEGPFKNKLFYKEENRWHGTSLEYCKERSDS